MRNLYSLFLLVFVYMFASCSNPHKAVSYSEDKVFFETLRKLERKPNEPQLKQDVIDLYKQAVQGHKDRISSYQASSDLRRYDNTISEYNSLQRLSDAIKTSSVFRDVDAQNYFSEIQRVREEAAGAYYDAALAELNTDTREGAKLASQFFQKTLQYVPNYKDASRLQKEAYERSIVNIMINPIQNGSYGGGWNNWNSDMRMRLLHEQLARDLGGPYTTSGSARFFTDMDARRLNIRPDWVIDISWSSNSMPPTVLNRYNREVSRSIEIGKDTAGRPVFQNVKAILHVTRYQNPMNDIDYRIVDVGTNANLEWNRVNVNNSGIFETATFSGDSRALNSNDWDLVNNRWNGQMSDQMMRQMYDQLVSELRSRIRMRT
ncbi:MAG TPA: hypothetical protein VLA58_04840 [Chitinophagaceae bacterium]|nr:hypothetical protein [Chitinophagaceae bacterium]